MAMDIQQNDVPAERKKQTYEDLDSCNKQTVFKQQEDEEQDALKSFETEEESRENKDSIMIFFLYQMMMMMEARIKIQR